MKFGGIDIETTGLLDPDHRIIEVFVGIYNEQGRRLLEFNHRIDPERSIAADAQRVHKIAYTDLIGKPKWPAVAPALVKVLNAVDVFVWHNGADFDGPFLRQELARVDLQLPKRPSIDTMLAGVWATPDGKRPSLRELCFACGVEYDPSLAHAADYDVDRMMQSFFRARSWGYYPIETEQETSAAA